MLSVVRQTATNRECAIQLLDGHDARQLVWQRRSSERQLVLACLEDARVDPFRTSYDEGRLLWSTLFQLTDQLGQTLAGDLLAIAIEGDHRPALRGSSDAIAFALTNLCCRTAPERLVFYDDHVELGELPDASFIVCGGIGKTATRTPDDHEPERGYASRWSSPTSGRSRMLSRADHLS